MRGALWVALLAAVGGCASPESVPDVVYDQRYGQATAMDVYLPDGGGAARPAVLLIHGGGWRMGDRGHFTDAAQRLALSGYVTATIDYRLVPAGAFPNAVQDCFCALAFLRAHDGEWRLDPARVAVMGYSAGGHLASLLGVAADEPRLQGDCAAGRTGPADAVVVGAGPQYFGAQPHQWVVDFFRGSPAEVPDNYRAGSPLAHVAPGKPPYLFVQARGDWFVDVEQSQRMRDALVAAGNPARLLVIEGGGHLLNASGDPGAWYGQMSTETPEAWLAIVDFLDRTVGRTP